jgi:hypothetical protein
MKSSSAMIILLIALPSSPKHKGACLVFEPINQISRARNAGAGAAKGHWFVFVDADSFPSVELFAEVATQIEIGQCIGGGATAEL